LGTANIKLITLIWKSASQQILVLNDTTCRAIMSRNYVAIKRISNSK